MKPLRAEYINFGTPIMAMVRVSLALCAILQSRLRQESLGVVSTSVSEIVAIVVALFRSKLLFFFLLLSFCLRLGKLQRLCSLPFKGNGNYGQHATPASKVQVAARYLLGHVTAQDGKIVDNDAAIDVKWDDIACEQEQQSVRMQHMQSTISTPAKKRSTTDQDALYTGCLTLSRQFRLLESCDKQKRE